MTGKRRDDDAVRTFRSRVRHKAHAKVGLQRLPERRDRLVADADELLVERVGRDDSALVANGFPAREATLDERASRPELLAGSSCVATFPDQFNSYENFLEAAS